MPVVLLLLLLLQNGGFDRSLVLGPNFGSKRKFDLPGLGKGPADGGSSILDENIEYETSPRLVGGEPHVAAAAHANLVIDDISDVPDDDPF